MHAVLPMAVFTVLAVALGVADLTLLRRGATTLSFQEAVARTTFFVAVAASFAALLGFATAHGWEWIGLDPSTLAQGDAVGQFVEAYLIELSLSVDNVFVIALIFSHFRLGPLAQHRVLFWGVMGAMVMRGALILLGAAVLDRFHWASYVFGAVLLWSAMRLLVERAEDYDVQESRIYRLGRRLLRFDDSLPSDSFRVLKDGRWVFTPLVLPLVVVEGTDFVFAVDSIPAVLAVTRDPFIAYTSNVIAVLGMRSLYFLVVPLLARLRYLKTSLVAVLVFVGVKLMLESVWHIPSHISLAVTATLISVGVIASLIDRHSAAQLGAPRGALDVKRLTHINLRSARRAVVFVVGGTVLLVGAALLVFPGPGIPVVVAALMLLATEFAWARLWLRRVRRSVREIGDRVRGRGRVK